MRNYKAKAVERIELPDRQARERHLREAGYNVFNLDADAVFVDLLTDSGVGAMSDDQWAALLRGDEAYAGSKSFQRLESAVTEVMGFEHIVPTHQGRGAENVLYGALVSEGDVVPNNTHADTTRAHIVNNGCEPIDCPVESDPGDPFQGNLAVDAVRDLASEVGAERIPVVVVTITNNSLAGQPVSIENLREARAVVNELDAVLVIDACRFAENAYFVKQREPGVDGSVADIIREQLSVADAIIMSGKKDGLSNIGGFIGLREANELYEHVRQRGILYEGFTTYGGMAGRDLEAMAVGLREVTDDSYIASRVEQVAEFGALLQESGVPIRTPVGGHAVYIDAEAFVPEIPREKFPGQSLVCALYHEGGVRGVELGELAFPDEDRPQFVRLCLPRRTYFRDHLEHVAETFQTIAENRDELPEYEVVSEPEMSELRTFSAELRPVE